MPFLNACTIKEQHISNKISEQISVQSIECLVDSTDSLDFREVSQSQSFKKFDGPEIGYGQLRKNLWVRLVLKNQTKEHQDGILSTDQIILENVDFYSKKERVWQQKKAGWGKAIQGREVPAYLHAFKISLKPNATDTVFYKIRNEYQVVRLPLHLFNEQQFYLHYYTYILYDGLVTMALLTAILYCLYNLFYSSARDRKTLILYFIYAVNFLIFYTIRISSPSFFTTDQPVVLNYFVNFFVFISTYTFYRFATAFIDPNQAFKNRRVSIVIDILFVLTIFVSLIPAWSAIQFFLYLKLAFFVGTIFYLIWYLIINFRKSFLTRIYFFMAMPLISTGLIEGLTNVFGILNVPYQFFEAFRVSICVEMLYILFALIFRERYFSKQIQAKLLKTELEMLQSRIEIQETEQKRIARDLHDDLGGTLASLKHLILSKITNLVSQEDEKLIKDLAQKSGDDLRRISHALMPPNFERVGLVDSIRELVRTNNSESIKFDFMDETKYLLLDSTTALNIYRILSEVIQNIQKHSGASKVLVQLLQNQTDLTLMIEDNGKGFEIGKDSEGLGIKNMYARAKNIGAELNFDSNKNGTTVILELPYA